MFHFLQILFFILIDEKLEIAYIGMLHNNPKAIAMFYLDIKECQFTVPKMLDLYKLVLFREGQAYASEAAKAGFSFPKVTEDIPQLIKVCKDYASTLSLTIDEIYVRIKKLFLLKMAYVYAPTDVIQNKVIDIRNYKRYKEMAPSFKELEENRQNIYIKSPEKIKNLFDEPILKNDDTTVDDLVEAFKKFLERKNYEKPITTKITNKEYSVKERKHNIRNILKEKKKVIFTELFEENNTGFIIVTFLSVLEMTKEKEILIKQDTNFSNITIELKVK